MAEVREFTLPDLGEGLTEATIVRWMVAVGDMVAVDQAVVEVETAKALVDVPCPHAGVVTARYGEEGDEIPVGAALVAVAVGAPAEAGGAGAPESAPVSGPEPAPGPAPAPSPPPASSSAPPPEQSGDDGSGNVLVGYGTRAPSARRRRPVRGATTGARADAAAARTPSRAVGGEATGGAAPHEDRNGAGNQPVACISPLVRRVAREHGIDLSTVSGSGPDGLVLRADVERAVREVRAERTGAAATTAPATPAPPTAGRAAATSETQGTRIPLRGLRGAVADKLSRSHREIPDATCWVDADATELLAARRAMNAPPGAASAADRPRISLLALLARICTDGLARFPDLNSTVDTEAREIVRFDAVHLGFAAQTERGLVVPVVRDAHTRSAEQLSAEIARLTESVRGGALSPSEITGGTFTLNNYGVFGVDGSTPIINHPEAAMLGVGRIVERPWAVGGELAVRSVVQLSLTFDHRVCDGGTAGGFLRHVADCVEQPAVLLRTL
ncbi:2-oxo acid dehydrogenase subunit E2 [Streptomyces sp. N2-109]|uniref:Dihydrolipoamide acetyltransferase component of pyruvate dehydrogenase complex n=1 Tax=Streptomyces gossypii TaxID=2883101 RepID=A0ABT2JMY2_9ACTN|nr:dihydrolipoamide acetyltransferase family protein [Streptomyces gossypii]MCT2589068.1 2-oxo acid dehydrogenase subunit E2 [Streptomyces gossypii]